MFKKMMQQFEAEFIGQSKVWEPISDSVYHGRMSDKEIEDMTKRYFSGIEECKKDMGPKWILHPVHKVLRLEK